MRICGEELVNIEDENNNKAIRKKEDRGWKNVKINYLERDDRD